MYTLSSFSALTLFGINPLTGEADAYGRRVLCDVSEEGRTLLCAYWGLPVDTTFAANWNSYVGEKPAVGSIMLAREAMRDLMIFTLLHVAQCPYVLVHDSGQVQGLTAKDAEKYSEYLTGAEGLANVRVIRNTYPSATGRNTHQMTGRDV